MRRSWLVIILLRFSGYLPLISAALKADNDARVPVGTPKTPWMRESWLELEDKGNGERDPDDEEFENQAIGGAFRCLFNFDYSSLPVSNGGRNANPSEKLSPGLEIKRGMEIEALSSLSGLKLLAWDGERVSPMFSPSFPPASSFFQHPFASAAFGESRSAFVFGNGNNNANAGSNSVNGNANLNANNGNNTSGNGKNNANTNPAFASYTLKSFRTSPLSTHAPTPLNLNLLSTTLLSTLPTPVPRLLYPSFNPIHTSSSRYSSSRHTHHSSLTASHSSSAQNSDKVSEDPDDNGEHPASVSEGAEEADGGFGECAGDSKLEKGERRANDTYKTYMILRLERR
ncbi:hypothetical protein C8R42DRAFT_780664 [Lentinula raphanica]|nr:hypothetical protein C8R42DRAFT_780664 [Lentinula raphanica]